MSNLSYLRKTLALWEHELNTDDQGLAFMAINRVF